MNTTEKKIERVFLTIILGLFSMILLIVLLRIAGCFLREKYQIDNRILNLALKGVKQEASWELLQEQLDYGQYNLEDAIAGAQSTIEAYCTSSFPGTGQIHIRMNSYRNELLSDRLHSNGGAYSVYPTIVPYVEGQARQIEQIEREGVPVLYVCAPVEDRIQYYKDQTELADEGDIIYDEPAIRLLEEKGIRVLDLALDTDVNQYGYDLSEHWLTSSALYAAAKTAEVLNEEYGFDFADNMYDMGNYYDYAQNFPEMVSYSLNHPSHKDFNMYVPYDDGQYDVKYMTGESWCGTFLESFINDDEDTYDIGYAYANMLRLTNDPKYEIVNKSAECNADKKIMITGYSFTWPYTSYMSQGAGETIKVYLGAFDLVEEVRTYKPDVLIYCVRY